MDKRERPGLRSWLGLLGTADRLVGHFYIHNGEDSRLEYAIVTDFFNGLLVSL